MRLRARGGRTAVDRRTRRDERARGGTEGQTGREALGSPTQSQSPAPAAAAA